jgi:hypothetical protein
LNINTSGQSSRPFYVSWNKKRLRRCRKAKEFGDAHESKQSGICNPQILGSKHTNNNAQNNINEKAMDLHNNSVVYYLGKQVKTDLFPYFVITTLCVKTYQERRAKSFDEN